MSAQVDSCDSLELPWEIQNLDEELNKQILADFTGERTGYLQVGPDKYFLPSKFAREAHKFYNFEVRSDDTWVITFPRSGTTWTQEMVWLICNNFDYKTASEIPLPDRFPFLEFNVFIHDEAKAEWMAALENNPDKKQLLEQVAQPAVEVLNKMKTPRFIKTHLPFSLLPSNLLTSGAKVIYVARNPKDVAVSFYHLNRLIRTQGYLGDFQKYWDYFERNLHPWTPYWNHVNEGWANRNIPNVLFMFYEDMKSDLKTAILKTTAFLKKEIKDGEMKVLMKYLDIRNFRRNSAVNMAVLDEVGLLNNREQGFIRRGENGSWIEEFSPELNERADRWIKDNLSRTDLRFPNIN